MLAKNAPKRQRFWSDDVNLELPSTQGGGGLKSDEAGADHHGALGALRCGNDGAAIGEGAERMNVRAAGPRDVQANGLRTGGEQQRIVLERLAVLHRERLVLRVDPRGAAADDFDLVL